MSYLRKIEDVVCEKCKCHPSEIIWDADFDYDGNDRIHEYGSYKCQCGDSGRFDTNDPYEDEKDGDGNDE